MNWCCDSLSQGRRKNPKSVQRPEMRQAPKTVLTNIITSSSQKCPLVKPDFFFKGMQENHNPKNWYLFERKNTDSAFYVLVHWLVTWGCRQKTIFPNSWKHTSPRKVVNCLTLNYRVGCFQSISSSNLLV